MRHLAIVLGLTCLLGAGRLTEASECGCEVQCPCCDHVCTLTCESSKEGKHCWEVECKPICVPCIRFPWDKCCKPKCAKIKYVKVLVKREYECEQCKYKWTPVCQGCCGDCCSAPPQAVEPGYKGPPPPQDKNAAFEYVLPTASSAVSADRSVRK